MKNRELIKKALAFIKKNGFKAFLDLFKKIFEDLGMECTWYIKQVHDAAYLHLPKEERLKMIRSGEIKTDLLVFNQNKIMDRLKTAIIKHHIGTQGTADDLYIDYVALGTGDSNEDTGTPPATSDSALNNEAYRAAPDERYQSDSTLVVLHYMDATTGNLTATTVASAAGPGSITVQAGQGSNFVANDRIRVRVNGGAYETVTIASVSTDTLTLKGTTQLSGTPVAGDAVELIYAELGLFGGAATITSGSGSLFNHVRLETPKNNVTSLLIEAHYNYITAP